MSESKQEPKCKCRDCSVLCTAAVTLIVVASLAFVSFVAVWIGSEVEWANVQKADNTSWFYSTDEVCAVTLANGSNGTWTRFSDAQQATAGGSLAAHCGACGECSTVNDVTIYEDTKNTLTDTAKACALKAFTGGAEGVGACFDEMVGFTPPCRQCWVDNVMCDQKECVFTCIRSIISGEANNNNQEDPTALNRCLECDEKMCGPAFTLCAGANRRYWCPGA